MKSWLIIAIVTTVLISLGGYTINRYGQSRYDSGVADTVANNVKASVDSTITTTRDIERIENETRNMSDDAIDADLSVLGIMRDYSDR